MNYATQTQTHRATLMQTLLAMLSNIKTRLALRRSYHQTVHALSQLSDHELCDLGLSRYTVQSDAWHAVYGTRLRG